MLALTKTTPPAPTSSAPPVLLERGAIDSESLFAKRFCQAGSRPFQSEKEVSEERFVMTQIIAVITKEYALLASDRRLTIATGPRRGQVVDDDACKLVSLCNTCGIGYSGLAHIEGAPTHEWIAKTLASVNCRDPDTASRTLAEHAAPALSGVPPSIRRQIFLICGWAWFGEQPQLRSHFCVVTNMLDQSGRPLAEAREAFDRRVRALRDNEELLWHSMGESISKTRFQVLDRNLRRLVRREIGPREALRLLVDEIIHSSVVEKRIGVGTRILSFCIPRQSVETQMRTGHSFAVADQPNEALAAFTYFDPTYDQLEQYGPTFICGEFAATDIKTEDDPARNFQSSKMRLLSLPKPRPSS